MNTAFSNTGMPTPNNEEDRMPTYSFYCNLCDKEFDRFCKYTDRDATRCPECDQNDTIENRMTAPMSVYGNTGNGGVGNVLAPDSTLIGGERGVREEHHKRIGG